MATGIIKTRISQGFFRVPTTANTNVEVTADNIIAGSLPTYPYYCAYTIAGASTSNSSAVILVDNEHIYIRDSATNANRYVRWFQFD